MMSNLTVLGVLTSSPATARHPARGATLIEVLVAVLILAIGLLGVAALQAAALRNGQSALERTQAVVQSYGMFDAMRANPTAARANKYDKGKTCAVPVVPSSGATLADRDWNNWMDGLKNSMGGSPCGQVACAGTLCTITITWDDSRANEVSGAAADAARTITTTTRI